MEFAARTVTLEPAAMPPISMEFAARTVTLEPAAMLPTSMEFVVVLLWYLPFTKMAQQMALSSSFQMILAPSCEIFGAETCAVNLVGSQLSLPPRTFWSVYLAASLAFHTVLSVVAVDASLPPSKRVLRWLVLMSPPLPFLLLYSPKITGAEFMSGPQPSALGSARMTVFKKTTFARPQERPR